MSVINQMLRDLDERRAPALAPSGTVPVAPVQALPGKRGRPVFWWMLLVALVGAVAIFVFLNEAVLLRQDALPIAPASPAAAVTPIVVMPASAPVMAPALPASETVVPATSVVSIPEKVASVPPAIVAEASNAGAIGKFEPKLALPSTPAASAAAPAPASRSTSAPAGQARPERERQEAAAAVSPSTDTGQRQLQAGRDALTQAQSLWNSGSRDAATELLQQAMDAAQRNAAGTPTPAANALLATLAREWSRMQLAEGRVGLVWETLTRLEPQLRGEPDLWAVRANAAQRLGRHQDSVYAYMVALESRPTEQRWLLGAAVSLAAMGKTESASEMAEKGRAAGPISRDVQTYLRQMGVPLKE